MKIFSSENIFYYFKDIDISWFFQYKEMIGIALVLVILLVVSGPRYNKALSLAISDDVKRLFEKHKIDRFTFHTMEPDESDYCYDENNNLIFDYLTGKVEVFFKDKSTLTLKIKNQQTIKKMAFLKEITMQDGLCYCYVSHIENSTLECKAFIALIEFSVNKSINSLKIA